MKVNTTWLWLLYAVCCVPSVIMWTRHSLRRTPPGSPRADRALAWADGIMFGVGTGLAISFGVLVAGLLAFRLAH